MTEGESLNSFVYFLAHTIKVPIDIQIADSQYGQIHGFQFVGAQLIRFLLLLRIMSTTVQFNNQFYFGTIKIGNIISDGFLPLKSQGIET